MSACRFWKTQGMKGLPSFEQAGRRARTLIANCGEYSGNADGRADQLMKMPGVRERIEELKTESSANVQSVSRGLHQIAGRDV